MRTVLADSCYFAGLFDPADAHHAACSRFFDGFNGDLVTTWAVFTEVSSLLPHHYSGAFFRWAARAEAAGKLRIESPPASAVSAIWQWMDKYDTLPMDFCDASLVYLAIHLKITHIATVDVRDFTVYRLPGNKKFTLVLA